MSKRWRLRGPRLVATLVTVIALTIAVIHIVYPELNVDAVALALVALAVLPWLGEILESLEGPGGWKVKYRELKEAVDKAVERVEKQDTAVEELQDRGGAFTQGEQASPPTAEVTSMSRVPEEELQHWIARYNEIRETQRSGYERTAAMTEVVQAMRKLASILPSFDWKQSLQSQDRGVRLAAYAYLFERPTCDAASPLVGTLTGGLEDKPFGQYWALKALRPVLDKCDSAKRQDVEPALRAFASRLGPGTDRQRELTRLLESMYDDSHNATRAR